MFDRVTKFIGEESFQKINNATVAVIGLGGVGGYAVECLVRSGIKKIIILDYDTVDISNINRQIISNVENITKYKTEEWQKRIKIINPNTEVISLNVKLDMSNIDMLFSYKIDPSLLEVTDIKNTSYDPIAKKIRKYLKDNNIKGNLPVVYSREQNNSFTGSVPSMIFTPAVSGILCANYIIRKIIEK